MSKISMTVLGDKYRSPQDIIREGQKSSLLRNNDIFHKAVNEMYNKLTLAEDSIIGAGSLDNREINAKVRHYSYMRTILSDFILTLDSFILQAENETYNKETTK